MSSTSQPVQCTADCQEYACSRSPPPSQPTPPRLPAFARHPLPASLLSLHLHSFPPLPGVPPHPPPPPPDPACHCGRRDGPAVCQPQALCGVCQARSRQRAQQCDRGGGPPGTPICGRGVCDQGQVPEADPLHGQVGRLGGCIDGCCRWWQQTRVLCVGTCGNAWEAAVDTGTSVCGFWKCAHVSAAVWAR